MSVPTISSPVRSLAVLAVSVTAIAALWLFAVPAIVSRSTFAVLLAFVIGGATVMVISWRNAQATTTVGQLLHSTETAGGRDARP